jgi:hypothetical protein
LPLVGLLNEETELERVQDLALCQVVRYRERVIPRQNRITVGGEEIALPPSPHGTTLTGMYGLLFGKNPVLVTPSDEYETLLGSA